MSVEFLDTEFEKVSYLQNLLVARSTGGDCDNEEYVALRNELLNNDNISRSLPKWLKLHRGLDSFWGFIQPKFGSYAERRSFLTEEFSTSLNILEFGHTEDIKKEPEVVGNQRYIAPNQITAPPHIVNKDQPSKWMPLTEEPKKNKIFIAHGQDNEAKQEVARFVESIGFEAIILHERANGGLSIMKKIERYSKDAGYAIILYTPCDLGKSAQDTNRAKSRARQNVVFEHGYLMAKLNPENIFTLMKGEHIEKPNDISGLVYENMDLAGAWKTKLKQELEEAGYKLTK